MKIYAISVVKNEADIIEQNLLNASKWADKIFVLDNGSDDETWAIVNRLANGKIVPWRQLKVSFYEGLRGEVFKQFRSISHEGDWWCFRLDADEFYLDDPRSFLSQVPDRFHFVCTDSIEYYLTWEDIEEFNFELNVSHLDKIRYYNPYTWSEGRFFRYRDSLVWDPKLHDRPKNIGVVFPQKIRLKHFQYRSPFQIQKRLKTRIEARADGFKGWSHASQALWKERILSRRDLLIDDGSMALYTKGCRNNHRHKWYVYIIKRIMYGLKIWS